MQTVFRSVDDRPVIEFTDGLAFVWRDAEAGWLPEDGAWAEARGLFGKEGSTMSVAAFVAKFPHADLSVMPEIARTSASPPPENKSPASAIMSKVFDRQSEVARTETEKAYKRALAADAQAKSQLR
ncbi:hypothetical protein [Erythrobacter sp. R86502]|uniref:hypothetical protein n=1 Tax=Erythrobacter sp. R86502 TaxID=3093846 RepID=UPI0036D43E6F